MDSDNDRSTQSNTRPLAEIKNLADNITSKAVFEEVAGFSQAIAPLLTGLAETYNSAKVVGFLLIGGSLLSLLIAIAALTPFLQAGVEEIVSLASLSGLFVISGTLLFAYLVNVEYKILISSQEATRQHTDAVLKNQEIKLKALGIYSQTAEELAKPIVDTNIEAGEAEGANREREDSIRKRGV